MLGCKHNIERSKNHYKLFVYVSLYSPVNSLALYYTGWKCDYIIFMQRRYVEGENRNVWRNVIKTS